MNPQRVKVKVADLIARVEVAKAAARDQHDKDLAKYSADHVKYVAAVEKALEGALMNARKGILPKTYYGDLKLKLPSTPVKPSLYLKGYDQDINLLKMAADDTITISTNSNFGKYL